jgi:hypothetical protein
LPKRRASPDKLRNWLAFLHNHHDALVGMDFFTVPTATFGPLWVFVVLHHEGRCVVHFAVTDRPKASRIILQLLVSAPGERISDLPNGNRIAFRV